MQALCELIVLEQFTNLVSERVATYINKQKPKTEAEAAAVADDFVLMHKSTYGELRGRSYRNGGGTADTDTFNNNGKNNQPSKFSSNTLDLDKICKYCHKSSHW